MRRVCVLGCCVLVTALWGCASALGPPELSAPDLAGAWRFEVDTGKGMTLGAMTLTGRGDRYEGTLTTNQGNNTLAVRPLVVRDRAIVMMVDSPNGEVVFKGTLDADGRSFRGTVTYFNGQAFPMVGRR